MYPRDKFYPPSWDYTRRKTRAQGLPIFRCYFCGEIAVFKIEVPWVHKDETIYTCYRDKEEGEEQALRMAHDSYLRQSLASNISDQKTEAFYAWKAGKRPSPRIEKYEGC